MPESPEQEPPEQEPPEQEPPMPESPEPESPETEPPEQELPMPEQEPPMPEQEPPEPEPEPPGREWMMWEAQPERLEPRARPEPMEPRAHLPEVRAAQAVLELVPRSCQFFNRLFNKNIPGKSLRNRSHPQTTPLSRRNRRVINIDSPDCP